MDAVTQMWFMNRQSTNLKLKTWFLAGKKVKTLTHSQQPPQAPKTHKKKSTVSLTYRTVIWVPQRSLLYRFLVLDEVKCKTHTQQQRTQLKTHLRLVNLTENAESTLSMLLVVALRIYQTLTYCSSNNNVSIDCGWNQIPNLLLQKNIFN